MPVYNGEKYLCEAIDSILRQTYRDFDFLIIDDGSTDHSLDIINSYRDSRIKLIRNKKNLGLVQTLNFGLEISDTEYIARMDCDDISLPKRLEKQVAFMDANPAVGISGTWVKPVSGKRNNVWKYAVDPAEIKSQLFFDSCLAHPSVIMRKNKLSRHQLSYDKQHVVAQDWGFWQKASFFFDLANLAQVLLLYRTSNKNVRKKKKELYEPILYEIDRKNTEALGIQLEKENIQLHRKIAAWEFEKSKTFLQKSEKWLSKLLKANNQKNLYPAKVFALVVAQRFYSICSNASCLGMFSYRTYFNSDLSRATQKSFLSRGNFLRRCLFRTGGRA